MRIDSLPASQRDGMALQLLDAEELRAQQFTIPAVIQHGGNLQNLLLGNYTFIQSSAISSNKTP
jgi:hypothetical protein